VVSVGKFCLYLTINKLNHTTMNVTFRKIEEIIKEHKPSCELGTGPEVCMSTILEMVQTLPTGMEREDLPYYGFELDMRIAAYVGEFLSNAELCGQSDPYNPLYRIYELATRVKLFTALHFGRVILDQLVDLDHRDAPDYVDAYFMKGRFVLEPGLTRTLLQEELEFIHREAPELINMWVNESVVAA
jgi:hypothetical protein